MKIFICLLVALATVSGQLVTTGICPNVKPIENFDAERVAGHWFEVQRYENRYQWGGDCVEVTYSATADKELIANYTMVQNKIDINKGGIVEVGAGGQGWFKVTFDEVDPDKNWWFDFTILNIDYSRHALLYNCTEIPDSSNKIVYAWILSRTRTLPPQSFADLLPSLTAAELSIGNFRETSYYCPK